MLAPSASDILKILDKIPEWVGLKRLFGRIEALEKKVAALEAKLEQGAQKPVGEVCPICEVGTLKVVEVVRDLIFGDMGVQQRMLKCTNCAHSEIRQHRPGKG
jgi:hypothetical protein